MLNYPYTHYLVCYKLCLCLLLLSNIKVLKQFKLLISQLHMLQTVTYVTFELKDCLQILLVKGDQFLSVFLLHKMVYISFRSFKLMGKVKTGNSDSDKAQVIENVTLKY